MSALELAEYGIGLSDSQEAGALVVERHNPRDLGKRDLWFSSVEQRQIDGHGAVGLVVLPEDRARVAAPAVDREGEPQRLAPRALQALRRAETESRGRAQRELTRDRELSGVVVDRRHR
jgi:hypothetical protein